MLFYKKIDVSEGIGVKSDTNSRVCIIYQFECLWTITYQTYVIIVMI